MRPVSSPSEATIPRYRKTYARASDVGSRASIRVSSGGLTTAMTMPMTSTRSVRRRVISGFAQLLVERIDETARRRLQAVLGHQRVERCGIRRVVVPPSLGKLDREVGDRRHHLARAGQVVLIVLAEPAGLEKRG